MNKCVAIISDVHGNLEALRSVLAVVPPDIPLVCLGDVVGYGPDPNACLDLLRAREAFIVMGNHDLAVADDEALAWFNPAARQAILWTRRVLTPPNLRFLASLPRVHRQGGTLFVHGTPLGPTSDYIDRSKADRILAEDDLEYCFVGHTHEMAFYTRSKTQRLAASFSVAIEPPTVVNVGSVGQPRDGNPSAVVCFWNFESRLLECRRLSYDVAATQRKMTEAGLPLPLITRLSQGL